MTTYTNVFTSSPIYPSEVSYSALSLAANTYLFWPDQVTNGTTTYDVATKIMDVTATAGPWKLAMPPANGTATGADILIKNLSANAFTVTDNSLNTIASVSSGESKYIYLTDNSSTAGAWTTVAFGVGSTTANAASLVGYGIIASGVTLNQAYPVSNTSVNYTTLASDRARLITDNTGVTMTMINPATVGSNYFIMFKNIGAGTTTLAPATGLIDSVASITLAPDESVMAVSNGTDYFSVGRGRSTTFSFSQLTKSCTVATTDLTSAESANKILAFTNTTGSAFTVRVPTTNTIWYVFNKAAEALTIKTVAGTGVAITANGSAIIYGDGTNILNAVTVATAGTTFGAGTAAAPSITFTGDTDTGIYNPSANTLGFAVSGASIGSWSVGGLTLVTALAVANGGTAATTAATARTNLDVYSKAETLAYIVALG